MKVARVEIQRDIPTTLGQQLQMYSDLNTQLRDNEHIHCVSVMQEEPLCSQYRNGSKFSYCATCPVEEVLGRNCGGQPFFSLVDYIGNEDLIKVTDHAIAVLTAIANNERVPHELYSTIRKLDGNKNPYFEYK